MLYDRARIRVQAGRGGDGSASFRREAHVPRGGPDGGDGGHGGDIVVACDDSLRDLQLFHRRTAFRADAGGAGGASQRHGANGETLVVRVPPGTTVRDDDGTVHDLVRAGQRAVVARGGAGGRGNKQYATPTRRAPGFAHRGRRALPRPWHGWRSGLSHRAARDRARGRAPACARRGRGTRGRAQRRHSRPRSGPECRRSRAGARRPRAFRAPARVS